MMNLCIPFPTVESILGKLTNLYKCSKERKNTQKVEMGNLDGLKKTIRALYFKKEIKLNQLEKLLETKGIILIEEKALFSGKLYIDDLYIGDFIDNNLDCGNFNCNGYKKINILRKECKLEKNYMNEKNNLLETSGTLKDINVQIIAELGRTVKTLEQVSGFTENTILELDKMAGEPVDIYANNVKIALGEVVVIDEVFGVRITEVLKTEK